MITTDTVTDCTANDLLRATSTETSAQTTYDGTTPIKPELVKHGLIKPKNDDQKQSKRTKEACTALGLPIDTKGGKKSPADNVAILKWLIAKYVTKTTDLPTLEPVAPTEITEAIEPAEVLPVPEVITTTVDLFGIDTTLETVTPSNQIVISLDTITEINSEHTLAQQTADKAIEHGKRVGVLLMQVKESLPHGDFLPWLIENVDVSERQAQRYMRNAKGLPAPIRTTGKTDTTVSYLNHDKAIKKIQNAFNTFDANNLPPEIMTEWQLANDAFNKIAQWIDLNAPLESTAIAGEVVTQS